MIIGIDLGTTNSLVTYYDGKDWVLIPNEFGNTKTPSVISFNKDGSFVVGDIAYERRDTHPTTTFSVFKRDMGNSRRYHVGLHKFSAQDLSTILIKYLIKQAETFLKQPIDEAVITVPAYFDDVQRHATKSAGILAGIKVERIINEPSAAALAYHLKYGKEGYTLVFDFGGGTLDISIVDVFDDIVDVISVVGDTELGGTNIDEAIAENFIFNHPDLLVLSENENVEIAHLAERTKSELSSLKESDLVYHYKNKTYESTYNNQLLTDICSPMLEKIKNLITTALSDGHIDAKDLDNVICIGGSSHVLFVRQYLHRLLGILPSMDINPEDAVAIGVGIVASIKSREPSVKNIILTDVCPFSIGIETINNRFSIIIPKNSTLPISKTSYFTTTRDNQKMIVSAVMQGDSPIASRNKYIGKSFGIKVEKAEVGIPQVKVNLTYDLNGILEVTVESSLDSVSETIITNPNLDKDWINKQKAKLNKLKEGKPEDPKVELLISRSEALHRRVGPEHETIIAESLAKFLRIVNSGKPTQVLRAIETYEAYLDKQMGLRSKDVSYVFEIDDSGLKH